MKQVIKVRVERLQRVDAVHEAGLVSATASQKHGQCILERDTVVSRDGEVDAGCGNRLLGVHDGDRRDGANREMRER